MLLCVSSLSRTAILKPVHTGLVWHKTGGKNSSWPLLPQWQSRLVSNPPSRSTHRHTETLFNREILRIPIYRSSAQPGKKKFSFKAHCRIRAINTKLNVKIFRLIFSDRTIHPSLANKLQWISEIQTMLKSKWKGIWNSDSSDFRWSGFWNYTPNVWNPNRPPPP